MQITEFKIVIDLITFTVLLILSIYHFILYQGRKMYREEKYNLYFAIFTFFIVVYLIIGSPLLAKRYEQLMNLDWIPPVEAFTILGIFLGFTGFLSSLLKIPKVLYHYLSYSYSLLALSYGLTLFSFIKGVDWYDTNLFLPVVLITAAYSIFISAIYTHWLIKNKLYKNRTVKIVIIGIFALIFYLLLAKLTLAFQFPEFVQRNNLIVALIVMIFAYALADKFNIEYKDLALLKENLEVLVSKRTTELKKANEELENASRIKTEFFINLAHETKTPLTIISNYLTKYIEKYGLRNEEIVIIKKNIDKLCKQILDYLNIERLNNTISVKDSHFTDFSDLIRSSQTLFNEYAQTKQIALKWEIQIDLIVKADAFVLEQIVNNLIDNAIKYTREGGTVTITLHQENDGINFKVSDNGIGITKDYLEKIFLPYFQVKDENKETEGIGMGLCVVKKNVESLNGTIWVNSTENKGSEFTVKLPLPEPEGNEKTVIQNAAPKQKITEKIPIDSRKNILIVEDNTDMLNYLTEELSDEYNVYPAVNGYEAIRKLDHMPVPDLIISDMMMNMMDGEEFFRRLKIKDLNSAFIFLTAKTLQEEKIRMLQAGAVDYIYKPFSINELRAKIQTITENYYKQKNEGLRQAIRIITEHLDGVPETPKNVKWINFEKNCIKYEITDRQKEILMLVAEGYEYKEIANKLNISYKTVVRHIENLFNKLEVHNKIDLLNLFF